MIKNIFTIFMIFVKWLYHLYKASMVTSKKASCSSDDWNYHPLQELENIMPIIKSTTNGQENHTVITNELIIKAYETFWLVICDEL